MSKKLLYFVSSNHERSSMAEAWAKRLNLSDWSFMSAGWFNNDRNPMSIKAMDELNIDLTSTPNRTVNDHMMELADFIISIYDFGQDHFIPIPKEHQDKMIEWDIKNPNLHGQSLLEKWAAYQEVCDDIATKVKKLESSLNVYM
ncbi:arsenate reductase/protein-tyrosine-phosphatase family protein [Falsibacillus albus]|nr:low molecular weight phosphatase family protein [Falsibacillus albus]